VPAARYQHTAVWTGDEMIVWGGNDGAYLDSGGRYDPGGDAWTPVSLTGAPSQRSQHSAVWTGDAMVVWGGYGGIPVASGGSYDPTGDTWIPTAVVDAPSARSQHTAVWTGSFMVVWGGFPALGSGSRFALGHSIDDDGDTFTECTGDCNDANGMVYPGAPVLCDGFNNDCDDALWPEVDLAEADVDADGHRVCGGDCDDLDPSTYPGAPETNDGVDNQCAGDPGFGLIDEISGPLGFFNPNDRDEISWPEQRLATGYEVARADTRDFSVGCMTWPTAVAQWIDPDVPLQEMAYYYLVRSLTPNTGSWGQDSAAVERGPICP
jgi:hypothetical protein